MMGFWSGVVLVPIRTKRQKMKVKRKELNYIERVEIPSRGSQYVRVIGGLGNKSCKAFFFLSELQVVFLSL